MTNSITDKKITEALEKHKQSLDDIYQHFWDAIVLNRLTNAEAAALFTSLMRQILMTEVNSKLLADVGIGEEQLTSEVVTVIQNELTLSYFRESGLLNESDDTTAP